jgi:membrane fusion protein, multidrug efflux system
VGRTGRIVTTLVLTAVAIAVVGPRIFSATRFSKQAPPPAAAPVQNVAVVTVHTVTPRPLELTTEMSGKVEAIHFEEGSQVEAGQVLLELDDTELAAQRERAVHRVELARRSEARQRQLLDDGLVSPEEYDSAHTELDVLQAELALVEAQLAKTKLRAPFGGVVGLRFVSPGAFVTPQTSIASLQDIDPIKVDFTVPERYASRIALGSHVELSVAGVDGRFPAQIYAIEPVIDPSTRSLVVRARRDNPDGHLRPGAFADVSVVISETVDALAVPSVSVIPELGGKKVFVVEAGVAQSRPIETGIRTDTMVQVTSGLEAGDQVIVGGVERVRAGDPVEVRSTE